MKKIKTIPVNWNLIIPTLIAIAGWSFVNAFSANRERESNLRQVKIKYLIDAYRQLANASIRYDTIAQYHRDMEAAVSDIQLFGNEEQIQLTTCALDSMRIRKGWFSTDRILNSLRNSLRKELKMDTINTNLMSLRFYEDTSLSKKVNNMLGKFPMRK